MTARDDKKVALPELRYYVKKDEGSRWAYVMDRQRGQVTERFDILKRDGWRLAEKLKDRLNAEMESYAAARVAEATAELRTKLADAEASDAESMAMYRSARARADELQRRVAELEGQSPGLPMAKDWAEANGWAVTQEWMNGWNAYRSMLHAVATAPRTMWREEWQGSGPQRGWHIRVMDGGNYGSVIAYLGDQISSDALQALVSHHNAAILANREGGKA